MSAVPREVHLVQRVAATLSALLAIPEKDVRIERDVRTHGLSPNDADLVVSASGHIFVVEVMRTGGAGLIAAHAERAAKAATAARGRATPVVAVPFMSTAGKLACERAGVSWFDFSGNGRIIAPAFRVIVEGHPNKFPARGRPASVFAPKSSRVARHLLMHPGQSVTQREIAHATGISEGFVSRIVARMEEDHYVRRDDGGALSVSDPRLLLDAWSEHYRFSRHVIVQGHVASRSGDALARFVGDTLSARSLEYAATGLAAAWLLTRFATFRIATFYLDTEPDAALKEELGFRESAPGANLWLVVPDDAGVFQGAENLDGLRCVHPVQVYLDLSSHPERSAEAADRLRAQFLSW